MIQDNLMTVIIQDKLVYFYADELKLYFSLTTSGIYVRVCMTVE